MKRYEVTRHLMDGDFPRQYLYTLSIGCALQAGQRLSGVDWGQDQATAVNPFNSLPLS